MAPRIRYVLYFDVEGSGMLCEDEPELKARAKQTIHECFCQAVHPFNPKLCPIECFRGDDGFAYFRDAQSCVEAAIAFYNRRLELNRTLGNSRHNIDFRIICFKDLIYGETLNTFTGDAIENILPYERDFGAAGTIRLISDRTQFYEELSPDLREEFSQDRLIVDALKGKRGKEYSIWQYPKLANTAQRFGWNHIGDRLHEDLVDKLKTMPDLIVYSGSMGGSIIGGLAYSKLRKKFRTEYDIDCDVFVYGTRSIVATDDTKKKDALSQLELAARGKNRILIIESTRKSGGTIKSIMGCLKAVSGRVVEDYVFLYEDNKAFSFNYSSYSSKGNIIKDLNILFPWNEETSDTLRIIPVLEAERSMRESRLWLIALISAITSVVSALTTLLAVFRKNKEQKWKLPVKRRTPRIARSAAPTGPG